LADVGRYEEEIPHMGMIAGSFDTSQEFFVPLDGEYGLSFFEDVQKLNSC
jgi:hypothetical protein